MDPVFATDSSIRLKRNIKDGDPNYRCRIVSAGIVAQAFGILAFQLLLRCCLGFSGEATLDGVVHVVGTCMPQPIGVLALVCSV